MTIVDKVRKFVEKECKKPSSKYGYDPYKFHFAVVAKYGERLAKELKADKEIVLISAWIHDIGSIIHGRKDHHLTSAKVAEKELLKLGYEKDKINKVKDCILSHRGSQNIKPKSLEAQILIEADTLSAFDDLTGLFQCALVYEKLSRKAAKDSIMRKLSGKWKQLKFKKSKEIIKPKYEAIKLLLQ